MDTGLLRADMPDKELSPWQGSSMRPCVEVDEAKSRGGYLCGKVRISKYLHPPRFFQNHTRHDRGRVEVEKPNEVYAVVGVHLPKSTPPRGLRAIAVTGSC